MDLTLSPTHGTASNRQIYPAILNLTPNPPADPGPGPAGRHCPAFALRTFNALGQAGRRGQDRHGGFAFRARGQPGRERAISPLRGEA